jgi:hypothetical protein
MTKPEGRYCNIERGMGWGDVNKHTILGVRVTISIFELESQCSMFWETRFLFFSGTLN